MLTAPSGHANLFERKREASSKKLHFDLKTGELLMGENIVSGGDNVVIDQIYEDGFFAIR